MQWVVRFSDGTEIRQYEDNREVRWAEVERKMEMCTVEAIVFVRDDTPIFEAKVHGEPFRFFRRNAIGRYADGTQVQRVFHCLQLPPWHIEVSEDGRTSVLHGDPAQAQE